MIRQANSCLCAEDLRLLASGGLQNDRMEDAILHVDECSECAARIEELSQAKVLGRFVHSNPPDSFQQELECQIAIGQLVANLGDQGSNIDRDKKLSTMAAPFEQIGPYRLISTLGFGGMGTVYLAEHQRLKRRVAIKLLPRERIRHPGWLERFNREMTSVAAIEHPNVVRAMDAGEESGWHYLVMEFLEGLDLSRVSRRIGVLSVSQVCEIGRQAALGLAHVHGLGMVHRDIKPSNLFLTTAGNVKLLDLGLVLSGDDPLASDDRLTTIGHLMGTVPYMAPEQINDPRKIDGRADIYSLGATMFRLLTGRPPFDGSLNLAQAIHAVANSSPQSILDVRPDLPKAVALIVDSSLARDPDERPSSAAALAASLSSSADSESTRSLIQHVLTINQSEQEGTIDAPALPIVTQVAGPPNRPWMNWLMLAAMPLMFAAGIFITIATDRGTITIRSEVKNIQVEILQSEKSVEDLALEANEKSVTLRSGKYEVRLKGANSDGFVIKNSKITLTRGGTEIVEIIHAVDTDQAIGLPSTVTGDAGRLFQGHAMQYWLDLLHRELDPDTLGKAMEAVGTLAENENDRLVAARAVLYPTETLGGIILAPEGDPSKRFMMQLTEQFSKFWGEPGVMAVIGQLEKGNRQSFDACMFLLSNLETGYFGSSGMSDSLPQSSGKNIEVGLAFYKKFAASEVGRQWLTRLDRILQKRVTEFFDGVDIDDRQIQLRIAIRQRLMLAYVLGTDIKNDEQLKKYSRAVIRDFNEENRDLLQSNFTRYDSSQPPGSGPSVVSQSGYAKWIDLLDAWSSLQIDGVTTENRAAILKALLCLAPRWSLDDQIQLLDKVIADDPTKAADQLVRLLAISANFDFINSVFGKAYPEFGDERILQTVLDVIVQHTSIPTDAIAAMASFKLKQFQKKNRNSGLGSSGISYVFEFKLQESPIDRAMYKLLFKAIEQSDNLSGVMMAVDFFSQAEFLPIDENRIAQAAFRSWRVAWEKYQAHAEDDGVGGRISNPLAIITEQGKAIHRSWYEQPDHKAVQRILQRLPITVVLRAITKELKDCSSESAAICDFLLTDFRMEQIAGPMDVVPTIEEAQSSDSKNKEFAKFIQLPESKEVLSELDASIDIAFGRLDQAPQGESLEIRQPRELVMAQLLRHRLHLLRLQGIEIKSGESWEPWLRKIVEIQKQRNESGYSENEYDQLLDTCLLNALGALDGWDKFPVADLLNSLVYEFSTSTDRYPITGNQLFQKLLAEQPNVFRNEFLAKFISADKTASELNLFKPRSNVKWFSAARWLSEQSDANFQLQLFPEWNKSGVEKIEERWDRWVTDRLNKYDTNHDFRITRNEFPQSEGDFGKVDENQDGEISFAEYYNVRVPERYKAPRNN